MNAAVPNSQSSSREPPDVAAAHELERALDVRHLVLPRTCLVVIAFYDRKEMAARADEYLVR